MKNKRLAEFLSVFSEVAREGSFSGAARLRGVTPSSVIRQIDTLEASLDARLFLRSTRSLTLTDTGQALLIRARRILGELDDARQEIIAMKGDVAGLLRIACFPAFGQRYLIPVVSVMLARYPRLRVDLDLTEQWVDPAAERLDAVIRIGEPADNRFLASRIACQTRLLCASPEYLARHPAPSDTAELQTHCLLDKVHGDDVLGWSHILGAPIKERDIQAVFCCDDSDMLRAAAVAGIGIGYLPDWMVGADIAAGKLVAITLKNAGEPARQTGIYLMRALARPSATLRVFSEELCRQIGNPPCWALADT